MASKPAPSVTFARLLQATDALTVPDATTEVKGIVELATDGESAAGVVVQGNDARLSDPREPTAHTHSIDTLMGAGGGESPGDVWTSDGSVGAWQAPAIVTVPDGTTTVKGIVELATDGESAADVVVQGNDSRLSDARAPTSHTHATSDVLWAASPDTLLGYNSSIPTTNQPPTAITCTTAGRALIDDADASAQRTTLGLGTLATQSGTFSGTSSGTNTGDQTITLTGDVTGSGTGSFAATIANDAVTYAKMQNVSATDRILGRSTAGAGDVEEIVCSATGRSIVSAATISDALKILGGGAAATGSGVVVLKTSPTLTTPNLGTPSALTLTNATGLPTAGLVNSAVTYAKVQDVSATDKVLGRSTAGAGVVEEISCTATGRSIIAVASTEAARQVLDVGNTEQSNVWNTDFYTAVPNANGWNSGGSGTGATYATHWSSVITTTENGIGVIELKTGSTGTGYYGLFTSNDCCKRGQAEFTFAARVCPLALSGSGEVFRLHIGMGTSHFSATAPTNTAEFRYDPSTYGDDNWRAITGDGTLTTTDTGVAATAASFQTLMLIWDAAGTTVYFYIEGALVATHTTHISTGRIGPFLKICKISTTGSADSILLVDWTRFKPTRSSAR